MVVKFENSALLTPISVTASSRMPARFPGCPSFASTFFRYSFMSLTHER